jgi:hypothetical protein
MRCKVAVLAVMLVLSPVGALRAQITNASMTGRVTDPTKGVVEGAKVTLTNISTNVQSQGTTNETGSYYVTNLLPGRYRVQVEKPGFKTVIEPGIVLHVQDVLEVNFEMALGSVAESITVEAGAPTVELTTAAISAVVNATTVRELPLNGRSWTDLVLLQPGVTSVHTEFAVTDSSKRGRRGYGNEMAVGGSRPMQNNYRLDGISLDDYSNGAPGGVLGGQLGVDAIEEFSVITSNYTAEYGRTSGGVVNTITRSGTNQFHGGVYEFLRNSALDARNFFDAAQIPAFRRNQFGADAGGPIRKDKVFVFGDYEGIRQSKGITSVDTVPSAAVRSGTLCSAPAAGTCSPTTITVDPSAQKYLPLWPLPNAGILLGSNGDLGIFTFPGQQAVTENYYTGRVDIKFSDKDSLIGTYLSDISSYGQPDSLNDVLVVSKVNRQFLTLQETHNFSANLVNSARVGYNRLIVPFNLPIAAINPLAKDSSLATIPGQSASTVQINGVTDFTGGPFGGSYSYLTWNSFQEYDDASWTHGTHFIKFGGGVERMQYDSLSPSDPSGVWGFGSLRDFLTNHPATFHTGLAHGTHEFGYRQSLFGVYIQDEWRATPSLTLNTGLRWEMVTVPTEVHGFLSNLIHQTDPTPHLGSPLMSNNSLRNFEPRVGFAWDPFHNGKTSVRAGFGLYDMLIMSSQIEEAYPWEIDTSDSTGIPAGAFTAGGLKLSQGLSSFRGYFGEQHPRRSYVMQWNLNVQRELAPDLTATLAYVGSRGVHLAFAVDDSDIVLPKLTPAGYLYPNPVGSGTKLNTHFGDMPSRFYNSRGTYDGLQALIQKEMGHGVALQGSFTWGKGIDNSSSNLRGNQFANGLSSWPWYDIRALRGLTDFNVARTLVINGTWRIPSSKSFSGPAARITDGWELGAIYTANTGTPFTATWGSDGDPQGLNGSDNYAFPDRLTGPGCQTLTNPGNPNNYIKTQCFTVPTAPSLAFYTANCDPAFGTFPQCFNLRGNAGRNILIGPGTSNLDFSVFKNNYIRRISENFNAQFRAEFFNILNRTNFAQPDTTKNTDIFDASGHPTGATGLITSTSTTSREIQFALKLNW